MFYNDPVRYTASARAAGVELPETRPVWEIPPEPLIVSPAGGSRVDDLEVEIWGWAWTAAGVAQVDVSLDGGQTWSPAELEPRSQWSWQRFSRRSM
jgi:sulfane dehydrogenase subunit SoxC